MVSDLLLSEIAIQWEFKEVTQFAQVCYVLASESTQQLIKGQPVVGELCTGDWWKEMAEVARQQTCKLLCIILYTDGIRVDYHGKINLTPIMMTLGNFDLKVQRSLPGKRLLGFIPQIHEEDIMKAFNGRSYDPAEITRSVAHSCMNL